MKVIAQSSTSERTTRKSTRGTHLLSVCFHPFVHLPRRAWGKVFWRDQNTLPTWSRNHELPTGSFRCDGTKINLAFRHDRGRERSIDLGRAKRMMRAKLNFLTDASSRHSPIPTSLKSWTKKKRNFAIRFPLPLLTTKTTRPAI